MSYHRKRHTPFVTLPRHKRADAVISLKGEIRRKAAVYGGKFSSHLVLDEPGRADLYNQWFTCYFPGTDRFTLWNADIRTSRKAFWEAVDEMAFEQAADALTLQEMELEARMDFEPAAKSRTGKILTWTMIKREPVRYAQFDDLTFSEQTTKLEAEIIRDTPPVIHESFTLDRSYAYGIGLNIVLDVEVINKAAIETAIDRFLAEGETDWKSDTLVPREHLPIVTEREALAAINYPTVMLGRSVR
jgi:hypothetical protein